MFYYDLEYMYINRNAFIVPVLKRHVYYLQQTEISISTIHAQSTDKTSELFRTKSSFVW